MKKVLVSLLVMAMALMMMTACGDEKTEEKATEEKTSIDLESLATLGDAFDIEGENDQFAFDEAQFVYVFEKDGTAYRVYADQTKNVQKALDKLDAANEDFNDKVKKTVAPLKISKRENLSDNRMSDEEMDKLIGKTGKELLDDGWTISSWNLDEMEFTMCYDGLNYDIVFDGKIKNTEDTDGEKEVKPLKVKSVKYSGVGDAATLENE